MPNGFALQSLILIDCLAKRKAANFYVKNRVPSRLITEPGNEVPAGLEVNVPASAGLGCVAPPAQGFSPA